MLTPDRVAAAAASSLSQINFPHDGRIVVAFSGGSDSTALLRLTQDFLAATADKSRLLAVTIDHCLRPESADEARLNGAKCEAFGIAHEIRRWDGQKPSTGIQAAAREARYRLLSETADGGIVLTGHTLDDQVETVAMRSARGTGRGLSGIAPATLFDRRTWFARPLLALRRADLRSWLKIVGEGWIDDPSNRDRRFERVRVRLDGEGPGDDGAVRKAFGERLAESEKAAALIRDEAAWSFDGAGRTAETADTSVACREGFELALAAVLSWAGQGANLPGRSVLDKAVSFCSGASPGRRITAAGCLMERAGGAIRIGREKRNQRTAGYGFDHLLASPDFALAQAIATRSGAAPYPQPPLSGYPGGYPD